MVAAIHRWKWLLLMFFRAACSPPEDPIKCSSGGALNCTLTNSYGAFPDRSFCRAGAAVFPASEAELVAAVAEAARHGRKMKAATRWSHSIPKLACPGGMDGLMISTRNLNKTLLVDRVAMVVTVESGVTLRELIQEAARAGLALPYAPYWWGLTVGGLMATGAHGSSLWGRGSSVHDHAVEVRIVTPAPAREGYAKVRTVAASHPDMNAVRVSLGVLGVISQVSFKLETIFKRSITNLARKDGDLGEQAAGFGRLHEFGDITWYPGQGVAVYRVDDRAPANATGDGRMDYIGFRSTSTLALALIRSVEEGREAAKDAAGKCLDSKIITSTLMKSAYGLTNDGRLFTGYPVVGSHNRLQASGGCLDSPHDGLLSACPWDPRIRGEFFHQTTFSIGLSNVQSFIQDVQRLRDLAPAALCGVELYNGILMRYVKASGAFLGTQEDSLDFDITYYRSRDAASPRLHEDVLEEIEQMALFKYGGVPHWGKNRNLAFEGAIRKYGERAVAFLDVKRKYDPHGLFSSEWSDQVLEGSPSVAVVKEGCALEGLCICSEDAHCAPEKGYLCRPGKVYRDARVCARSAASA